MSSYSVQLCLQLNQNLQSCCLECHMKDFHKLLSLSKTPGTCMFNPGIILLNIHREIRDTMYIRISFINLCTPRLYVSTVLTFEYTTCVYSREEVYSECDFINGRHDIGNA